MFFCTSVPTVVSLALSMSRKSLHHSNAHYHTYIFCHFPCWSQSLFIFGLFLVGTKHNLPLSLFRFLSTCYLAALSCVYCFTCYNIFLHCSSLPCSTHSSSASLVLVFHGNKAPVCSATQTYAITYLALSFSSIPVSSF